MTQLRGVAVVFSIPGLKRFRSVANLLAVIDGANPARAA